MKYKKLVFIFMGIALISLGLGFISLNYLDNSLSFNLNHMNFISIDTGSEQVRIGSDGIFVKDVDDYVKIDSSGINIKDGDDNVSIGIKNFPFFSFHSRDLRDYNIEEKLLFDLDELEGVNSINISSVSFPIKITSADIGQVKVSLSGSMRSSSDLLLNSNIKNNRLNVSLATEKSSYSIVESNISLDIIIPYNYSKAINLSTSSGNIYIYGVNNDILNVNTSSGNIYLYVSNIDNFTLNASTSSGRIRSNTESINIPGNLKSFNYDLVDYVTAINLSTFSFNIYLE